MLTGLLRYGLGNQVMIIISTYLIESSVKNIDSRYFLFC
jgi:hypothetical protein